MNRPAHIRSGFAALVAAGLVVTPLAGCGSDDSDSGSADDTTQDSQGDQSTVAALTVGDPWARSGTAGGNAAAYMELTAGDEAVTVTGVSVSADVAETAEIHETVTDSSTGESDMGDSTMEESSTTAMGGTSTTAMGEQGGAGMMSMQPVESVEVPAGETVPFEPGGYHVMLLNLVDDLVAGDVVDLVLTFDNGETVDVVAKVRDS